MMNLSNRSNGTVANRIFTHPNDPPIRVDADFPKLVVNDKCSKDDLAASESL